MTNFDFIRERLYQHAGLIEPQKPRFTLQYLIETQWSNEFEQLMRNRLLMGALRYGLLQEPNKPHYDHLKSIIKRAHLYGQTGNDELLVDIANLALVEYVEGIHPNKHFESHDDTEHCKIK